MAVRKYIFNTGILTSAFSFLGLARTTRRGPRDWRLLLMWVSALVGLALAVGTVIEKNRESEDY